MNSLRECVLAARKDGKAIGHFNAATIEMVWGIFRAARSLNVPVIVGFSEGERDFVGVRQAPELIRSIREEYQFPIFCNADHTYSFERVREAVDAGYDSVIFDGAQLPLPENIASTKQCVGYARMKRPEMLVEGELGYIGKSSSLREELPPGVKLSPENLTSSEDAARFVAETGVDLFAPAVGNVHGMFRGGGDPALDLQRVAAIRDTVKVPLVLHGASGNSADDIRGACERGVSIVHVSTELRVAYRKALQLSLQENTEEMAPYKYMRPAGTAIEKVVEEKIKVLSMLT